MDEKYLMEIYNTHGGQQRFGAYQNFYNKVQNDPEYRAKLHDFLSGRNSTEKSYSDWESSIKKKRAYWSELWVWFKSNPTIQWFKAFPRR